MLEGELGGGTNTNTADLHPTEFQYNYVWWLGFAKSLWQNPNRGFDVTSPGKAPIYSSLYRVQISVNKNPQL